MSVFDKKNLAVGVSAFALTAAMGMGAQAASFTLTGNEDWDSGVTAAAVNGDNVDLDTFTLTVNDTNDGITLGAITGSTGDLIVQTDTANTAVSSTIDSIAITGDGQIDIQSLEADDASTVTVVVTNGLSTGGALNIKSLETGANTADVLTTVGGNVSVTGITTLTGNTQSTATLDLDGATNTFTGGVVLDDDTGLASLTVSGAVAQGVTGTINGAGDGEGTLNVTAGTNLVTFNSAVGATSTSLLALNVGSASAAGNAKFVADVDAVTITVNTDVTGNAVADFDGDVVGAITVDTGDTAGELASATIAGDLTGATTLTTGAGGDHALITFDGTTAAQTVTGAIDGDSDGNGDVTVTNTFSTGVTFANDLGVTQQLDTVSIGTAGATSGDAVFTGKVDAVAVAVVGGGTTVGSTADFNETSATSVSGAVTITAGNVDAEDATANFAGGVTGTIALDADNANSADATAIFDGAADQAVTGNITAAADGEGIINIVNTAGTVTLGGNVGANGGNAVEYINIAQTNNTGESVTFQGHVNTDNFNIGNGSGADAITVAFDTDTNANFTVTGAINGDSSDTLTLQIIDTDSNGNTYTFASKIGASSIVDTINVGDGTTNEGLATFSETVNATTITVAGEGGNNSLGTFTGAVTGTTINVNGGADASEDGAADFNGSVAVTNINVTGGGNASAEAVAKFSSTVTGAINLDDGSAGEAIAAFDHSADSTVAATITAVNGEGTVQVIGGETPVVTFSKALGTSAAAIGKLDVGSDGTADVSAGADEAGNAVFLARVDAGDINITGNNSGDSAAKFSAVVDAATIDMAAGAAAGETASGDFDGNVTAATSIGITANATGGAASANFSKNVTISGGNGTLTLNDDTALATLTLDGTTAQTFTGKIDGAGAGEGTVTISANSDVTFSDSIGGTTGILDTNINGIARFANGKTLDSTSTDVAATGSIESNGQIIIGAGDTITFADGATLIVNADIASDITNGAIDANTNNATVVVSGTLNLQMSADSVAGETIQVIDATGGTLTDGAATYTVADTFLYDYTVTANANDVDVAVAATNANTSASSAGVRANDILLARQSAVGLAANNTTLFQAFNTALNTGGTTASNAIEQITTQASSLDGAITAASSSTTQSLNIASGRLASLRQGAQYASAEDGFSAGGSSLDRAFWFKGFGNLTEQDERDNASGYDAETIGFSGGIDVYKDDYSTVGVAVSYANTEVEGDSAADDETDIDSYQFSVYGDYTTPEYYLEGFLAYSQNHAETEKTVLSTLATADYNGTQFTGRIAGGKPYEVAHNQFITPNASLQYSRISYDSYTFAGGATDTVNPDDVDQLIATAGAKYHTIIKQRDARLIPEVRLSILGDLIGDEAAADVTPLGASTVAVEGTEVEQFGGIAGLGLTYDAGKVSVGVDYDLEYRSDYMSHTGMVEAKFKF